MHLKNVFITFFLLYLSCLSDGSSEKDKSRKDKFHQHSSKSNGAQSLKSSSEAIYIDDPKVVFSQGSGDDSMDDTVVSSGLGGDDEDSVTVKPLESDVNRILYPNTIDHISNEETGSADGGSADHSHWEYTDDETHDETHDEDDHPDENDDKETSEDNGSGIAPRTELPSKSQCETLRDQLNVRQLIGAYIPSCTHDGLFEVTQCHASTGECWCVDKHNGSEIEDTKTRSPQRPDCLPKGNTVKASYTFDGNDLDSVRQASASTEEDLHPEQKKDLDHSLRLDSKQDRSGGHHEQDDIMPDESVAGTIDIQTVGPLDSAGMGGGKMGGSHGDPMERPPLVSDPGVLAAIVAGGIVGLLCAVLLVMFLVYRMRKKDEGSYPLDEPKRSPSSHAYQKASNQEFYA